MDACTCQCVSHARCGVDMCSCVSMRVSVDACVTCQCAMSNSVCYCVVRCVGE